MTPRTLPPSTQILAGCVAKLAAGDGADAGAPWVDTVEGPRRQWHVFRASAPGRNRNGYEIDQASWQLDPFRRNPVILWMHDLTQRPHGRGEVWLDEGGLMLKVYWDLGAPCGRESSRQVEAGILSAVSVRMDIHRWVWTDELGEGDPRKDGPIRLIAHDCELLEVSLVTVPGDPNALREGLMLALSAPSVALDSTPASTTTPTTTAPAAEAATPTPTEEPDMALRALLLAALSLPEATPDEAIVERVQKDAADAARLSAAVRARLGLDAAAAMPEDLGAALSAPPPGYLPLTEVEAQLAAARTQALTDPRREAAAEVEAALSAGKITPATKSSWLSWAEKAPAECRAALAGLKAGSAVPLGIQAGAGTGAGTAALSAEEERQRKAAGLSLEEWQTAKTKRRTSGSTTEED